MAEPEHSEKRKFDESEIQDGVDGSAGKKQATDNNNVLFSGAPKVTIFMDCPLEKIGMVIGKKGANIHEIMKRSNSRIVIDQGLSPPKVMMTGLPQDLAIAMALVAQIIQNGPGILESESSNGTAKIDAEGDAAKGTVKAIEDKTFFCPLPKIGELVGTKGITVNEIMRRSGTKIRVLQENVPPGRPNEREVLIIGTVDQIVEAKYLISRVLTEGPSAVSEIGGATTTAAATGAAGAGGSTTGSTSNPTASNVTPSSVPFGTGITTSIEEDVPADRVGVIIGAKGNVVADIARRSNGCKVLINQEFPVGQPHKVKYTGTREQIEIARVYVAACVSKGPHVFNAPSSVQINQVISLIQAQTGKVLGPQGSNHKDIQYRSGTRIQVVMSEDSRAGKTNAINTLKISGNMEQVLNALDIIFQLLATPSFPESQQVTPSPNYLAAGAPGPAFGVPPGYLSNPVSAPGPQGGYPTSTGGNVAGGYPSSTLYSNFGQPPSAIPQQQQQGGARPVAVLPITPSAGPDQGLGPDGTYGILSGMGVNPDGQHVQTADLRNEHMGKIVGKGGANLSLISTKSGASLVVLQNINPQATSTKILITGQQKTVTLAGQMIQEILVNGPSGLHLFPDVKAAAPQQGFAQNFNSASPGNANATSSFSKYVGAALSSVPTGYPTYGGAAAVGAAPSHYGPASPGNSYYQQPAHQQPQQQQSAPSAFSYGFGPPQGHY